MGKVENNFAIGSVSKHIINLAVPMIVAQLINVLYNVVDRIYIGRIPGEATLAMGGLGLCLPLISIINAFANLFGMGGAPLCSIARGRGDNEEAEKIMGNSFMLLIIFSVVLMVVGFIFKEDLLWLFGASANTIGYANDYMTIYLLGTLFVLIGLGMNSFINSQGFAKIGMLTVLLGAVTNIILDPIFIFVFNMGVKGAALATILSQALSAFWVLKFLMGKKTILRIKKQYLKIEPKTYLPCLALGMSPFVMQSTESIISVCFNSSLLKYGGDIAVGSMTILSSIMQFSMLPLQGLTQGAQPIISFNYGARKAERVKKAFFLQLIACVVFSGLIWAIAMFVPNLFIGIFTPDPDLTAYTKWAIRIYMAVSIIFGLQIGCQQTFVAIGNAKVSLFLAVLRKIILLIPLIFLLPNFFEDKAMAVFLAEPVADVIAVTTTVCMFTFQFRKTMKELNAK